MQAYCFAQASLVACMLQVQWSARGAHAPHTASCISWWASGSTRKLFHSSFFVFLLHSCSPFPLKVSLAKVSSPKDTVEYCSLLTRKTRCFDPVCGERYFVSHFYHTPSPCWCESQESNRSRLLLNCQDSSWSCPGADWIATVIHVFPPLSLVTACVSSTTQLSSINPVEFILLLTLGITWQPTVMAQALIKITNHSWNFFLERFSPPPGDVQVSSGLQHMTLLRGSMHLPKHIAHYCCPPLAHTYPSKEVIFAWLCRRT